MSSKSNFESDNNDEKLLDELLKSRSADPNKIFSLSSKTLDRIGDFYQILNEDGTLVKQFEDMVALILDDIQKTDNDFKRLEKSYLSEKDKNEEKMKNMIEEAELQLSIETEKLKQEAKVEFIKGMEKLKVHYDSEIIGLQESLSKMQLLQKKQNENKLGEESTMTELKNKLDVLEEENKNLRKNLRESQTKISLYRSEVAELKDNLNDKNYEENEKRCKSDDTLKEITALKNEINALQMANTKLSDTNDILRSELDLLSSKLSKSSKEENEEPNKQLIFSSKMRSKTPTSSNEIIRVNKNNSSSPNDGEDEIDSGFFNSNDTQDFSIDTMSMNKIENSVNDLSDSSVMYGINDFNDNMEIEAYENKADQMRLTPIKLFRFNNGLNFHDPANVIRMERMKKLVGNIRIKALPPLNDHQNEILDEEYLKSKHTPQRMFKIIFAGDAAVGKTSFIMRYCKGKFVMNTNSTLGVDFHMKLLELDGKSIALQLWDTCGQERYRSIAKSYFRKADGIVLMYDCTYEKSFLNVRDWVSIINDINDKKIPVIIVANKTDLRDSIKSKGRRIVESEDGVKLAKEYDALFIETSAKDGTNMEESLIELCRQMSCHQDIELKSDSIRLGLNDEKKKVCC